MSSTAPKNAATTVATTKKQPKQASDASPPTAHGAFRNDTRRFSQYGIEAIAAGLARHLQGLKPK